MGQQVSKKVLCFMGSYRNMRSYSLVTWRHNQEYLTLRPLHLGTFRTPPEDDSTPNHSLVQNILDAI